VIIVVSFIFSLTLFVIGSLLLTLLVAMWHWPSAKERDMAWVKAGPPGALPVSTVARSLHMHPPYYYGMQLLFVIEAVELAVLVVTYFYLRAGTEIWPPPGIKPPSLLLPTISLVALLLSVIPAYIGDKAIMKGDKRKLLISLVVTFLLGLVYLVTQFVYYVNLPYTWQLNAYTSIFWVMAGFHFLYMVATELESLVIIIWTAQGYFNAERNSAEEIDGQNCFFGVALFIPVYITLYLVPYLL
jgi:cytochrome c oxidase subunit III